MKENFQRIKEILGETLCRAPETIDLEMDLRCDLGMDSLDAITTAVQIEDSFGVKIADDALKGLRKVKDIVALL